MDPRLPGSVVSADWTVDVGSSALEQHPFLLLRSYLTNICITHDEGEALHEIRKDGFWFGTLVLNEYNPSTWNG